jgi:signal transduction histidine kinase
MRAMPTHVPDWLRRPDPILLAIVTLLGAAGLVIYLQHRDVKALDRQTAVILQKVAERTAAAAATEIRRTFEGPVYDTLQAVNPLEQEGWMDLLAEAYREGLAQYPQVERFFVWHASSETVVPGEVLFFGGQPAEVRDRGGTDWVALPGGADNAKVEGFYRDSPLGRTVFDMALQQARSRLPFAAAEMRVGRVTYDVFVRLGWTDPKRAHLFVLLGYVVNQETVHRLLFSELHKRKLARLLDQRDSGTPRLTLRVVDETGKAVFGTEGTPSPTSGRAPLWLVFYPVDEIRPRLLSGGVPHRRWEVVVSPDADAAHVGWAVTGYWLSSIAVVLMLVALGLALEGRNRAARLSGMQAEFVSHVSHQLKTPLALLSAVSETLDLERVRSPEKLAHYLGIVRSETARLSVLVDRILEFSRVQNRRCSLELEAVDLAQLVRESAEGFEQALKHEGVTIRVHETRPHPVVAADPAALEQVLANLLDNAVKYSHRHKEVTVRVGQAGTDAFVEVQDQGIGIAAEERIRIFEKFYRVSGAAPDSRGFGLGLAIVRELVTAHRGRIDVESEVERGSTFRVRLPLLSRKDRLVGVSAGARLEALAGPAGETSPVEARRGVT